MYKRIGGISEEARLELLSKVPQLVSIGGKPGQEANYKTSGKLDLDSISHPEVTALIPREKWVQSIVVCIPPKGHLHRHTHDLERDQGKTRYHVVLQTNDGCTCRNGDEWYSLGQGGVYWMEPYLEHESDNHGDEDRLHIILVTNDE